MAIQRWDPLGDLIRLRDRVNRLFEEVLSRSTATGVQAEAVNGWKPALDLFERAEDYVLRTDLPGVAASDLEVEVVKGVLTVRGERKQDPAVPRDSYLRVERPHGRFALRLSLPESVDPRSIRATHRGGVMEIVLPKRSEEDRGRIRVDVE